MSIESDLADLLRQDFERGMDEFFKQRPQDADEFLRDMAKFFAQFEPGANNVYRKVITALRATGEDIVLSTINYDLLIELAVCQLGLLLSYSNEPLRPNNLRIRKIHGSCNFLPNLPPGQFKNVKIIIPTQTGTKLEAPVRIVNPRDVIEWCERRDHHFAPAMAIYAPSKWIPFCTTFVEQQRQYWQSEVHGAEQVFIIGASVHERDTHIWEALAESTAWLVYVDPKPEDFYRWANSNRRNHVDVIDKKFGDAIPLILQRLGRRQGTSDCQQ